MRFWTREIIGWCFVLLGALAFYICFVWLSERHMVEAGMLTFIAFVLFRGGIHLVKVAVAARICMRAQERVSQELPPTMVPTPLARTRPTELPGPSARRLPR